MEEITFRAIIKARMLSYIESHTIREISEDVKQKLKVTLGLELTAMTAMVFNYPREMIEATERVATYGSGTPIIIGASYLAYFYGIPYFWNNKDKFKRQKNIGPTYEGIDIETLSEFLEKSDTFRRDDVINTFPDIKRQEFPEFADSLMDLGILKRGENNSKVVIKLNKAQLKKILLDRKPLEEEKQEDSQFEVKPLKQNNIVGRFKFAKADHLPIGINPETKEDVWVNIKKNPHMLIAGSPGNGKSAALINIIMHIEEFVEADMLLIDPKRIEFSEFSNLTKLVSPIVTDTDEALRSISEMVKYMDEVYLQMKNQGTKDYKEAGFKDKYIIIDELSDLMMVAEKRELDLEYHLCRIAQLGRAAGLHLIIATQRPSKDVITGLIKDSIPTRISFRVTDSTASKIILDTTGAELLRQPGQGILKSEDGMQHFRWIYVSEEEKNRFLRNV